jgi:drug/metabolite transporter (DMT)-like permease
MVGLACFYRAMAIGTVSVIAPISAAGVTLPVIVGVATGDRLSALTAAGLVVIVAGVVLASREKHADAAARRASRVSIGLALLAAVGFGGFFAMSDPPADVSVPWTLVLARGASLVCILALLAVRRPAARPSPRLVLGLTAIGLVDLLATSLISLANTRGEVSIVSVVGSMYPVMTVILAAVVLHERLRVPQRAGIVLALAGVALVALG